MAADDVIIIESKELVAVQVPAAPELVTAGSQGPAGPTIKVKAGAPTDADFTNPADGLAAVDSVGLRFYVRVGGVWKSTPLS